MPKGPKGVRGPADTNAAAVVVGRTAAGEIEDKPSKAPGYYGPGYYGPGYIGGYWGGHGGRGGRGHGGHHR